MALENEGRAVFFSPALHPFRLLQLMSESAPTALPLPAFTFFSIQGAALAPGGMDSDVNANNRERVGLPDSDRQRDSCVTDFTISAMLHTRTWLTFRYPGPVRGKQLLASK